MRPPPFYARPGLNIETYDARIAADKVMFGDDASFYVATARRFGGPVLELGAGTGRIAVAIAEAGFAVVGLDRSKDMLACAEGVRQGLPPEVAQRLRFIEGDMARFELSGSGAPSRFKLVIAPFRAFQLLAEAVDLESSLACVHRHFEAGGRLVFDLTDPRPAELAKEADATELYGVRNPLTGRFVRVIVTGQALDESGRVLTERWRFVEIDRDGRPVRTEEEELRLRWIPAGEMRAFLEAAGFAVEAEYADFAGTPCAAAESRDQAWITRKLRRKRLGGWWSAR